MLRTPLQMPTAILHGINKVNNYYKPQMQTLYLDTLPAYIFILVIGVIIYFLPGLLARKKNDATIIASLNFFLGWTLIAWVILLVWALTDDKPPVVFYNQNQLSKSDEITKFKKLLDEGAITKEEFEKQKENILNK